MSLKPPSAVGFEYVMTFTPTVPDLTRAALEQLGSCRIELIHSNQWRCNSPWYVPRRSVNNDFFFFVLNGAVELEGSQGKKVLRRGDFFYSAPGEIQAFGFTGRLKAVEHILVHCRVRFPGSPLQQRLFKQSFLKLPDPEGALRQLEILPPLWYADNTAGSGLAESLLKTLFMDLVWSGGAEVPVEAPIDPRLAESVFFMQEHFKEDLPIQRIAQVAELSEVHFRRLFRSSTGRTPTAFLAAFGWKKPVSFCPNPSVQ